MPSWLHQKRGSARDFWLRRSQSSSGEEKHVTACLCRSLSSLLPLNPSKSRLFYSCGPQSPPPMCTHTPDIHCLDSWNVCKRTRKCCRKKASFVCFPSELLSILIPPELGKGKLKPVWPLSCYRGKCIYWLVAERKIWPSAFFPLVFLALFGGLWRGGGIIWNLEGLGGENCNLPVELFLPVCLRVQREMSRPNRTKRKQKRYFKKHTKKI